MPAPKISPSSLARLFQEGDERHQKDKQLVEALKKRLSERLLKDPAACKKAALILENWLQQKPKK